MSVSTVSVSHGTHHTHVAKASAPVTTDKTTPAPVAKDTSSVNTTKPTVSGGVNKLV